ncbi:hypothetical protein AJ87_30795 [Rhizobium yanglingense]|nr:hypothetical protein AJ87_30795 [Rhizobium yanglingense]
MPDLARAARPDAMICTGRSDFPNQVNNVLCFPYIFRGALDCGATAINEEMKMAAVKAIAGLAREEVSDVAARAYSARRLSSVRITSFLRPSIRVSSCASPRLSPRPPPRRASRRGRLPISTPISIS